MNTILNIPVLLRLMENIMVGVAIGAWNIRLVELVFILFLEVSFFAFSIMYYLGFFGAMEFISYRGFNMQVYKQKQHITR